MRHLMLLCLLLPQDAPASGPLRLPCIADTVLSSSGSEVNLNGGDRSNIRLKGIEDLSILDFDVTAVKGKTVEEARLFITPTGPNKLRSLGISTISSPWKEGTGTGTPAKAGEACFAEAAHGERPWAHPGSDFNAVSYGHGGSLWFSRELKAEADGWLSIEVPPALIHAMVEGNSFGLALSDEHAETMHNNSIYTREQTAKAPHMVVTKWKAGAAPPSGAKKYVAATPKPAADRTGEILKKTSAPPAVSPVALTDGSKVRVLFEGETNLDAPAASRIWDGKGVTLDAARGEHVGFEILVETPQARTVRFEGAEFAVSRVVQVGSIFDPLIPVAGDVAGKGLFHVEHYVAKGTPVGGRKLALTLRVGDVELRIPVAVRVHGATIPDTLSFQVSLNAYGSPGQESGEKEGSPGFMEMERAFHRLAHEHRGTLAIVPYSHRGYLQWCTVPEIRRTGSTVEVTSWAAFDERYGPYCDGTAFKGLPRDGVPMEHLYWPMHENWPLPINDYYSYKGTPEDHWRDAPEPEQAFAPEYGKAFGAMVREFGMHAAAKKWTQTQFHVFLNNKPDVRFGRHQPEGSWWRLDEPVSGEDHLALRYFGKRAVDAVKDLKNVQIKFRADLSRPQCRRDFLDGILGVDVVAGSYRQYPELVFDRGEEVWVYGGVPMGGSGEAARAWAIQVFLDGADGLVPWLALGTVKAWEKPEDTALLLPPKPGMEKRPYATLRLKGLRRGEQDVELLRMLLSRMKATRAEVKPGLAAALGLLGSFVKTSERDAGQIDYGHLDPDRFEALRRSILEALDK
ncbi:MAG TPA: hypothetical protein VE981_09040 [Planctomycetota bacterium]|nr:hypothetical protein [Planctomycetota bacterium]